MYNNILIYIVKILLSHIKRDYKNNDVIMKKKGFNMLDFNWLDVDLASLDFVNIQIHFTPEQFAYKLTEITGVEDSYLEELMEYFLDYEMYEYCHYLNIEIENRLVMKYINRLDV